jgi:CRISPR-associated protein Cas5t
MTREYIWFRNLTVKSHIARFGAVTNRIIDHMPEHPGGQIPVRIDVLEEVNLFIYISHEQDLIVEKLKEAFKNPKSRLYPLHLGRSEDWIVFDGNPGESIKLLDVKEVNELYGKFNFYTWIPSYEVRDGKEFRYVWFRFYSENEREDYKIFYKKVKGSPHLLTSFYHLKNGIRVFERIPVKLFEGGDFPMHFGKPFKFLFDTELKIPLFFAKMKYPEVEDE